jgi:polysaccharide export outer membrane protein
MFTVGDNTIVQQQTIKAEANYVIQKNDLLTLDVSPVKGERIIDPVLGDQGTATAAPEAPASRTYLVDEGGKVKFPGIDEIKIDGLTIRQAEEILQKEYARLFVDPFVTLTFSNKRVTVLGASGGQVIPLTNENMRLTEVLALSKGIGNDAKANNIRLLRQDKVFLVDFSTFEGYLKNNMIVEPGDIVYVEPNRRPFLEGLRDYGAVISLVTSIGAIVVVIIQATK